MRIDSHLQKSRHGIYYLRIQRDGLDRRWSLRTRDPLVATIHAHELSARLLRMKSNPKPYSGFTLKAEGDKFELTTEDNDADRASGTAALLSARQQRLDEMRTQIAVLELAEAQSKIAALELALTQSSSAPVSIASTPVVLVGYKPTITLATALNEYELSLYESDEVKKNDDILDKSDRQALSILSGLRDLLGADFDMSGLVDDVIEKQWLPHRLKSVARTTAKRDLSFVRGFVAWSVKQKYVAAELKFAIAAKGENYDYFSSTDLELIFDNLPKLAANAWEFWIPILGLYTGARIAELAGLQVDYFYQKSGLNIIRIAGTKTEGSDHEIPLHPDLVKLGLLDYVESRRKLKFDSLFDITHSNLNGAGAQASKFFTAYKAKIKLKGRLKVFHSFRHTITDHLNQAGVNDKAGAQYTGHATGGDVRNSKYGRRPLSMLVMQVEAIDKINWLKYCDWEPDFNVLSETAKKFLE